MGATGAGAGFVMVEVLLLVTIIDLVIAEVSLVFGSLVSLLMRSELAVRLGSAFEADAALGTGGSLFEGVFFSALLSRDELEVTIREVDIRFAVRLGVVCADGEAAVVFTGGF